MSPFIFPSSCRLVALLILFVSQSTLPVQGKTSVSSAVTIPLKEYSQSLATSDPITGRKGTIVVTEYYGRIAVGDPPQFFDVVFDTGSGNVVIPTLECTDEACASHKRFVGTKSKTATQLAYDDGTPMGPSLTSRDTTTITYGTGKLTGEYIRDTVCMGTGEGKTCTNMDFLGVTRESRFPFLELPFDGIFGLGLVGLSAGNGFNFVENLLSSAPGGDPTFAVFLRGLDSSEESEITFGGFRSERLADPQNGLHWLPMLKDESNLEGYWLVTMRDVYVRGKPLNMCDDGSENPRCKVAMDTGSSLMMGPPPQINALLDAIGDCGEHGAMPPLRFIFDAVAGGTFEIVLEPSDYAEWGADGDCATAFQPIDLPPQLGTMLVLGQTALRKYYSIYDAKRWRVGIGLAKHELPDQERAPTLIATSATNSQGSPESCEDWDEQKMAWKNLPGCQSFVAMGYCQRFQPLAQHYCRLSCDLCSSSSSTSTSSSGSMQSTVTFSDVQSHQAEEEKEEEEEIAQGRGASVRPTNGFSVSGESRQFLGSRGQRGGRQSGDAL